MEMLSTICIWQNDTPLPSPPYLRITNTIYNPFYNATIFGINISLHQTCPPSFRHFDDMVGHFGDHFISECDPELASHIFFYLWNSVRDNIYQNNPQIFLELKRVIADQIRSVRKQESVRINHNFARHILVCISLNGDKKKTVGYSHLKLYG